MHFSFCDAPSRAFKRCVNDLLSSRDCEGPRTSAEPVVASGTSSHGKHHLDEAGSGSLPPSPTASVSCESHGDHRRCDGPATMTTVTSSAAAGTSSTASASTSAVFIVTAGAPAYQVPGAAGVVGLIAFIAAGL